MTRRFSLPVQLLIIIAAVVLFGTYLNEEFVRVFYTVSILFKQVLSFLLPFIIFAFIFSGIVSMKKNAPAVLGVLLVSVLCSNGLVALLAYGISILFLPHVVQKICIADLSCDRTLEPFYDFSLPIDLCSQYSFFCTKIAPYLPLGVLLLGVLLGLAASSYSLPGVTRYINGLKQKLEWFFNRIFIPLLPLYVVGFLLKIQYEGVLSRLIEHYGGAFFLIVTMQICYLVFAYFFASGFSVQRTLEAIRNASASYLTAFSTMSSTATVPVSVACATKNTGNKPLAQMAMPIMANIHLLGDSMSTPILAMVTMLLFQGTLPAFGVYMVFVAYFCFSMFAVSGIPGGGIIVMLPVLQAYLDFSAEMTGIMIALYMLLDSFGTAANVMGDGALVILVNKMIKKLKLI